MAGPEALITVARRAEELGYDSLWVTERLLFPRCRGRTTRPPLTARSRRRHARPGTGSACRHAGESAQIIQICAPRSATPGSKNRRQNGRSSGSAEAPSHLPSRKPGRFWAALITAACPCPGCSCKCLAACGADRRLILALRSERNVSGRTAQTRHAAGLSLDRASAVRWIWMAATGAIRLGRDSDQAATVEQIRTWELPGRVLRVVVRAGKRRASRSGLRAQTPGGNRGEVPHRRHRERRRRAGQASRAEKPGSETGRWRARAGFPVRQG
jgi:hypothetical protein